MIRWPCWYKSRVGNFGRDTGVSTPTLAMSATGSLVTTGSQDLGFNVSSERRCSRRDGVPVSIPGHWGSYRGQRDEHPLLALQHHCQHHLVSHPEMDQTSPCLASRETSSARQVAMVLALCLPPSGVEPFYSPREFSSFTLVGVYIPPQADVSEALQTLADQIHLSEHKHPDSLLIILGDFNRAKLNHELPKFRQHINCPTRDNNILDHCYTVLKEAYHSVPRAALGHSDHCLVHLIPTYKHKLKSAKPAIRTVKKWTTEAEELQDCFDCTDWSVFEEATGDLDTFTDTVTSYISFCEEVCVPTKTFRTVKNNKPWFTAKLSQLRQAKEEAYRNGDRTLYNALRNDSAALWRGLQDITNYKRPSPPAEASKGLADDLNDFYCRI
ncbi:hypothetical protein N1851_020403 [Merluccius polli]|uniref:Endonuclease/exonuclease/phosphatase domain-containing protein n=1 Tax=Merluccius polli TaxID=89951 RepID=A0AA47MKY1_MERPO|nr:hypothetical protein N1851_020403 [Merluccius polli]